MTVLRVGLTGGIGSGKSTVAAMLRGHGALVVDADMVAREVVAPGCPGLRAVAAEFGAGVLGADGALDRAALGRIVFADPDARRRLEAMTHPLIARRTAELLASAPDGAVIVHDVPLLVERGQAGSYDLVVVVLARAATRLARLARHRGMTEQDAMVRLAAQASDEQRRAVADVVIDNDGGPEELTAEVDRLWDEWIRPRLDPRRSSPCGRPPAV